MNEFSVRNLILNFLHLFFFAVLLIGCDKSEIDVDYSIERISPNGDTKLQQIFFVDEYTGFIVGGQRGNFGLIYKTIDGGTSWDLNYSVEHSIYGINFINDSIGFACGEELILLRTINQGKTWEPVQFYYTPNYLFQVPFKQVDIINDTTIYLTGGMYYDRGLIAKSYNGGASWDWDFFDFELSSSHFFSIEHGIFCGYGHLIVTRDGAKSFETVDFNGDFFTSMHFMNISGLACGYDGGIYRTENSGDVWKTVLKSNNLWKHRIHLNDIYMIDMLRGMAVGNDGILLVSYDGGISWKKALINQNLDFYSIYHVGDGYLWLTCSEGKICKIRI